MVAAAACCCRRRGRGPERQPTSFSGLACEVGVVDRLLLALSQNVAVPLGERSGVQTLSRVVPGEEPAVDATLQLKMVRMANGE